MSEKIEQVGNLNNINNEAQNNVPETGEYKNKIMKTAVAGMLAVTLAGVGLIGCSGEKVAAESQDQSTTTETVDNTTTSESETTETDAAELETEMSREELVASLEIPAGLDTETLAKVLVEDRITSWYNTGFNTEQEAEAFKERVNKNWFDNHIRVEDSVRSIAEENANIYMDAYYAPDWDGVSSTDTVDSCLETNYKVCRINLGDETRATDEYYRRWDTVVSVYETYSGYTRILTIIVEAHDNNDIVQFYSDDTLNGSQYKYEVMLSEEDGTVKIGREYRSLLRPII